MCTRPGASVDCPSRALMNIRMGTRARVLLQNAHSSVTRLIRRQRGTKIVLPLLVVSLLAFLYVTVTSLPPTTCNHEYFTPRKEKQFTLDYGYVHDARGLCALQKDGSDENAGPDVVIMVLTMSKNMAARQAIRDTYGSVARGKAWPGTARQEEHSDPRNSRTGTARVVFLMGQTKDVLYKATEKETLAAESREYGDVVQWEGLVEDYSNLTLKVLLGLRWVRDMCPHAHHVVKTDDDTFIHLPRFFQHLRNPTDDLPDNVIRGAAFGTANVLREGKYSVSREAFPLDTYPPHVKGQIYSMPVPLAMRMLGVAEYVPYNRMEDVHTTGTLACVVGATHFGFTVREFNYCSHNCSACDFSDGVRLAARHVTPDNFREVWNAEIHPEACSAFTTTILKIASFLRPKTCYFFL